MAFAVGVFTLAAGNPVVTGTTISSTVQNNTMSDVATGLSTCVLKDGPQIITANIPMATFKLTGLGSGTAATDSASFGQLAAELISTGSVAASATAVLDFTGLSSAYRQYLLRISRMLPDSNGTTLWVRVSTDGGATYAGDGDYSTAYVRAASTVGVTAVSTASASGVVILFNPYSNAFANFPINGEIVIDNPSGIVESKTIRSSLVGPDGAVATPTVVNAGGSYTASVSAINAIRLVVSAGRIAFCVASLYGIKAT